MDRCLFLGLAILVAASMPTSAKSADATMVTCNAGPVSAGGETPNLHGQWDFLMVPRGQPSFGLMTIGFVGSDYGGSLAPTRTAPVVIRKVELTGHAIKMVVASREGDVLFDGNLSAKGDYMCGTVTYHGGEKFPMIAHKRPMAYRSPSQAERAQ